MSDNYQDSDIESPEADKRAHHNMLERTRRDQIKNSYNDLLVTMLKDDTVRQKFPKTKYSRHDILAMASEVILSVSVRTKMHKQDIKNLKKGNEELKEKISSFKTEKSTANSVLDSSFVHLKRDAFSAFGEDSGLGNSNTTTISKRGRKKKLKSVK